MPPAISELDNERGVPIYRKVFQAVVASLGRGERGELSLDEQPPTIMELARWLGGNPDTVARAYKDLERAGFLVTQRGRGTFPARRPRRAEPDREGLLRGIVERALGECARHGLGRQELFEYLRGDLA